MENRKEKAYRLFKAGYNCAQSVAGAFADLLPIDEETALRAASAFGGGFGRTRNLCGAVSAMGLVLGLIRQPQGDAQADKTAVYKDVQELDARFRARNGSDNCAELLKNVKNLSEGYAPQVRDAEYYKVRPCAKFVLDSVEILEEFLREKGVLIEA